MRVNAGAWLCLLGGNQIWGADLKTISRVSIHNPVSGERMKLKQVGDEAPLFMSVLGRHTNSVLPSRSRSTPR